MHLLPCPCPPTRRSLFEPTLCLEQLRYSGVFEATSIKKSGFPFRFSHEQFVKRYKCVGVPELPLPPPSTTPLEWAQAARSLMISMPRSLGDGHRLRLGATMVPRRGRKWPGRLGRQGGATAELATTGRLLGRASEGSRPPKLTRFLRI